MNDRRAMLSRISALLAADPALAVSYGRAKQVVRAFRRPAFYEVSTRCNLTCEGCYYFTQGFSPPANEVTDSGAWQRFFAAEAERGVTMAYFVGAEPALHQERMLAAAPHFPWGNIGTNGLIRLDPAIPYRIGVSVWGVDEAVDRKLRGASALRKALRNYAGDPRAIILFTLTPANLHETRTLAGLCRDHGLPLTFNMYSPTQTYRDRLAGKGAPDRFFRFSDAADNLCWDVETLALARHSIDALMDEFPETIVYSRAYHRWATQPGPLYDIDPETGIARDCHSRMIGTMRYFTTDLQPAAAKCGTSDAICSECRMYSGGWSSKFEPRAADVRDGAALAEWTGMIETLGRIFLFDRAGLNAREAA